MKSSVVSILVAATLASLGLVHGELKSVAILFRHGERTPGQLFGKYGDSAMYRDIGPGQLTLVSLDSYL